MRRLRKSPARSVKILSKSESVVFQSSAVKAEAEVSSAIVADACRLAVLVAAVVLAAGTMLGAMEGAVTLEANVVR